MDVYILVRMSASYVMSYDGVVHISLQEEYYLTHQCFFTNRALYLLVWNVIDGEDGIKSLTVWLQNLQVPLTGHFQASICIYFLSVQSAPLSNLFHLLRAFIMQR